jgi:metal-responsive CopG/Arc/MetJ family transcriptional regulator
MATARVTVTLDEKTLERLDQLIKRHRFRTRSKAIQKAVQEKLARLEQSRLARECAKLDPTFEKAMAEEEI